VAKTFLSLVSVLILSALSSPCCLADMDLAPMAIASSTEATTVDVPLELALKEVRGEGKRRLIVFEDPYCPYCRRLEMTLEQVDNVTVYVFLYPILTADSVVKARSIWCSTDRAAAWREWMLDGKAPTAAGTCTTPIARVLEFAKRLRVSGTPTIFFADGRRVSGAIPADEIERYLTEADHQQLRTKI
jgi:thiol:disulfide interchange protein DsbC